MKKILISLLVILFSVVASAESCRTYFIEQFVSEHTVSPQYFFTGMRYETAGGYSPLILLKSPARIILTPTLKAELVQKKNKQIVRFQILVEDRDTAHVTHRAMKQYGFVVGQRLTYFGTYWTSYELSGERGEIVRFLRNRFARSNVIWAGKTGVRDFALRAKRWLSLEQMQRAESW